MIVTYTFLQITDYGQSRYIPECDIVLVKWYHHTTLNNIHYVLCTLTGRISIDLYIVAYTTKSKLFSRKQKYIQHQQHQQQNKETSIRDHCFYSDENWGYILYSCSGSGLFLSLIFVELFSHDWNNNLYIWNETTHNVLGGLLSFIFCYFYYFLIYMRYKVYAQKIVYILFNLLNV